MEWIINDGNGESPLVIKMLRCLWSLLGLKDKPQRTRWRCQRKIPPCLFHSLLSWTTGGCLTAILHLHTVQWGQDTNWNTGEYCSVCSVLGFTALAWAVWWAHCGGHLGSVGRESGHQQLTSVDTAPRSHPPKQAHSSHSRTRDPLYLHILLFEWNNLPFKFVRQI